MFKVFLYQDKGWEFEPGYREVESVEVKALKDIEKIGKELYRKYSYYNVYSVDFKIDEDDFKESYFRVEIDEMPY